MNIFNAAFDFATAWPTLFGIANLASSSTFLQFGAFVFMWTRAENHSRRDILWQRMQYSKSTSDSCGNDSRTAHQNWESGISWKISRAHKLFRRSQNWSCNSSRILAISREVENGFCKNSSYLSSEKYCWNSISSD